MVPDRQKVRTDGMDGRTDGQRQNYIPPTLSRDKKTTFSCSLSCTWMTIIDYFMLLTAYLKMFHGSILLC